MGSGSFGKVATGEELKEKDHRGKIHQVTAVDHTAADAAVVEIDAKHFNIVVGSRGKSRDPADGIKSIVHEKTGKGTEQESYHGILGKAAGANTDRRKYSGKA